MATGGPARGKVKRTPLGAFLYWTTVLGVWAAIFFVGFLAMFAQGLPDTSKLYDVSRQPSITYLDRSGALIAVSGTQYAPPVDVDTLPPYVPAAFIAIEDRRFYHHPGFDPIGITRALYRNVRAGHVVQGGSTLTQQLARNLFLTPDQTWRRKVQEIMLAVWLERKFNKKQILGLYLNRVYFGAGAYGIEAASQRYFDKPAKQLTVGEAALLAGLMKGPSRYSPVSDSQRAGKRANIVLNEMEKAGVITSEQRGRAVLEPIKVSRTLSSQHAQYFVDWLNQEIRSLVGEPQEDLVVETTLDLPIQMAGERAIQALVARDKSKGVEQSALVAMDGDGRVRALVGGADYAESQFNRAVDAKRQAGSSWKPFVYLTAMEKGFTPDTQVVDEPVNINGWEPKNYTNGYLGAITIETAVAQSINTVAARVGQQVGYDNVAATAHRLGITSTINTQPSMSLGAVEVSPLEMAAAYTAFSNGGFKVQPHGIVRIRTVKGKPLFQYAEGQGKTAVIGNPALGEMVRMMRQVLISGTGRGAALPGYDLAGKTGTTSDYKDAWFVGYTGGFTTAVWVGKDNNTPMRKVTGGGTPAAIWRAFMSASLPRLKTSGIPTGPAMAPPPNDPIGTILDNAGGSLFGGDQAPPTGDQPPEGPVRGPDQPPPAIPPGALPTPPQPQAPRPQLRPVQGQPTGKPPVKKDDPLFF